MSNSMALLAPFEPFGSVTLFGIGEIFDTSRIPADPPVQVVAAVKKGRHRTVGLGTVVWWAHRLLSAKRLLMRTQQRALIRQSPPPPPFPWSHRPRR